MLTRSVTVTHSDILLTGVVGFFEVVGRGVGGAVQQKTAATTTKKEEEEKRTKNKKQKNKKGVGWGLGGGGVEMIFVCA